MHKAAAFGGCHHRCEYPAARIGAYRNAPPCSDSHCPTGHRLEPTLRALRRGGVVAYPTEAVFGIGCEPMNADAVSRILRLKARVWSKGLILIAAEFWQLEPYLAAVSRPLAERALRTWPGAVTWLWPASPRVPAWIRGRHRQVAVRISAHPPVRALCLGYGGALVSTSANHAGAPPARDALGARARFAAGLDAVLAGAVGGAARPSEIRDLQSAQVVRPG